MSGFIEGEDRRQAAPQLPTHNKFEFSHSLGRTRTAAPRKEVVRHAA